MSKKNFNDDIDRGIQLPKKEEKIATPQEEQTSKPPTMDEYVDKYGKKENKSDNYVSMNFSVDREFRRQFKLFAFTHDMKMVDVFQEAFFLYQKTKENRNK